MPPFLFGGLGHTLQNRLSFHIPEKFGIIDLHSTFLISAFRRLDLPFLPDMSRHYKNLQYKLIT